MDSQISIVIAERCLPGAQGLDPDFGPLGGHHFWRGAKWAYVGHVSFL